VHSPLLYLPAYYVCRELGQGDGGMTEQRQLAQVLPRALGAWRDNFGSDVLAMWAFFVPAHLLRIRLVPLHARAPFVAAVGFAWSLCLSYRRGAHSKADEGGESEGDAVSAEPAAAAAAAAGFAAAAALKTDESGAVKAATAAAAGFAATAVYVKTDESAAVNRSSGAVKAAALKIASDRKNWRIISSRIE